MKAKRAEGGRVNFWCPACEDAHTITYGGPQTWTWNESTEAPTFTPSVKVGGTQWPKDSPFFKPQHPDVAPGKDIVCHSFVTDGRIQFLGDCTHALAGQTVDIPDWPYD